MSEPENLVLTLLREIRSDMATKNDLNSLRSELKGDIAKVKDDVADVRSEVKSLAADVASDLMTLEKRLSDRINHLNRAVMEYHSSAVGHGVLFSEIDERLRRVEQHLKLPPNDAH
jgi:septation ring formation regulator EzrA